MNKDSTEHKKVMVSLYPDMRTKCSYRQVDLFNWFFDPEIKKMVEYTRRMSKGDKEKYNNYKSSMPCITPAGIFTERKDDALEGASGYICVDIDGKDNPHIADMNLLRDEISKIKNVAFCALSLSAEGVFCFIPIKHPEKNKEHYNALIEVFRKLRINIDNKCGNLSRLRIASYDANAYINRNATLFELYIEKKENLKKAKTRTYRETSNISNYSAPLQFFQTLHS